MTRKNAEKKQARALQDAGNGLVPYASCLNLLRLHGFDEAKRIVEERVRSNAAAPTKKGTT